MKRLILGFLVAAMALPASALNWHIAHPWRAEAVLDGRLVDYGDDRFLHLFSYRHLKAHPDQVEQGIRATAGSLDSAALYYDFRLLKHFGFDQPGLALTLDMQRSEDFDGAYDRQLTGLLWQWTPEWQFSLQGDVFADKAISDIYLGVQRNIAEKGWLRFQWVLADAYFNDKTTSNDRFLDRPHSFFLQWLWQWNEHARTMVSANILPPSRLQSISQGDTVSSRQHRLAIQHKHQWGDWDWQLEAAGEYSRRKHRLVEFVQLQRFRRDLYQVTLSSRYRAHRWQPRIGVHWMKLEEIGWFGRAINESALVERREPILFTGVRWRLNVRQTLEPTIYLARPQLEQTLTSEWALRDKDDWIGKLSLPWVWKVREENNATLTLSLSVELHRVQFGGGNIQFHWPL